MHYLRWCFQIGVHNLFDLMCCRESHTVIFSVALRPLFPRPKYIPQKSEISMEKHVFMDGPNKTTYQLVRSTFSEEVFLRCI